MGWAFSWASTMAASRRLKLKIIFYTYIPLLFQSWPLSCCMATEIDNTKIDKQLRKYVFLIYIHTSGYLLFSNVFYCKSVLCNISWLPTHQVLFRISVLAYFNEKDFRVKIDIFLNSILMNFLLQS